MVLRPMSGLFFERKVPVKTFQRMDQFAVVHSSLAEPKAGLFSPINSSVFQQKRFKKKNFGLRFAVH